MAHGFPLSIISIVFVWIGGASLGNYIFVGLLIFLALGVTFAVGFGLKPEIQLLSELKNINSKLDALTKEVEEIKKAIKE
ncbi:MAG: hypothetical protein QW231_07035 [Candidatus Bathyarchaeia archaeon]